METSEVCKEEKISEEIRERICARMDEGLTFGQACVEAGRRFSEPERRPERKECPTCQAPLEEKGNLFLCGSCGYRASVEELRTVYNARL